jgi:hypothetical protein
MVGDKRGFAEQLIFAGSHPGVRGTPVERDRILVYVTITNQGPRAIRAFWDGPPPNYKTPPAPAPPSAADQFTVVLPGNSATLAVGRAVKIVYAPDADQGLVGDTACGDYLLSWCCPPTWTTATSPAPIKEPLPPRPVG